MGELPPTMFGLATLTVTVGVVLAAAILFMWSGRRTRHLFAKIPTPTNVPVIGMILEVWCPPEELYKKMQKWALEYGPVINISFPGISVLMLSGPDEIQAVLKHPQNIKKGVTYAFLKSWLATGLLTSAGDKWRSRRRLLTPTFHYKILEDSVPVFNANSTILVDKLRTHLQDDHVEISEFVHLCTLDSLCETIMGTSVNVQKGKGVDYLRAVKRMCELFVYRSTYPFLYPDYLWRLCPRAWEESHVLRILKDFSGKIINEKRLKYNERKSKLQDCEPETKKRLSLLDMLLVMSDEGAQLTDEDLREEVDTFIFAGHDTTGAAICWTLFLLGTHQDIQDKVVSELSEIFGSDDREPTAADLGNMSYLDMVMKEALRLYPSVPSYARLTETEMKICEHTVPAGVSLLVCSFIVHRNPEIYPDPDKFDPERFSPEQISGRHPYAYIPFSAGPRNCIGQKFARLEEKCILSAILRNFRLESRTDIKDVVLMPDVVLKPKTPLKIKLFPRV